MMHFEAVTTTESEGFGKQLGVAYRARAVHYCLLRSLCDSQG